MQKNLPRAHNRDLFDRKRFRAFQKHYEVSSGKNN